MTEVGPLITGGGTGDFAAAEKKFRITNTDIRFFMFCIEKWVNRLGNRLVMYYQKTIRRSENRYANFEHAINK